MLWGDLKKKSGGHRRYRGKKVQGKLKSHNSCCEFGRLARKRARSSSIAGFLWRYSGGNLNFGNRVFGQDTEDQERADQERDRLGPWELS